MSDDRPKLCDIAMEEATFGVCATSRDGQHHCALMGEHGRHCCGCGLWGSSARERAEAADIAAAEARGYDNAVTRLRSFVAAYAHPAGELRAVLDQALRFVDKAQP